MQKQWFDLGKSPAQVGVDFLDLMPGGPAPACTIKVQGAARKGVRMKRRTRLILSAAAGVVAALLSFTAIRGAHAEAERVEMEAMARYGGDRASACVTLREIEPGEEIDEGNTEVVEWVSTLLPEDAITSLSDVAGRTATSRIPAHAPLSESHFVRPEQSVEVPRGRVAVSVASDPEHAVGGLARAGDKVDVYASADAVAHKLTTAEVIDSSAGQDGAKVQWVTLAVRPSAVKELLAATSQGMVTLVMPGAGSAGADE